MSKGSFCKPIGIALLTALTGLVIMGMTFAVGFGSQDARLLVWPALALMGLGALVTYQTRREYLSLFWLWPCSVGIVPVLVLVGFELANSIKNFSWQLSLDAFWSLFVIPFAPTFIGALGAVAWIWAEKHLDAASRHRAGWVAAASVLAGSAIVIGSPIFYDSEVPWFAPRSGVFFVSLFLVGVLLAGAAGPRLWKFFWVWILLIILGQALAMLGMVGGGGALPDDAVPPLTLLAWIGPAVPALWIGWRLRGKLISS